jgi:hypothetical protein
MATYRQVHIKYWQDPFVENLQPLQRYFYLYLMTNSKTTQCGCYEISSKLIEYETGLSQEQINSFIELLEKNNKIKFNKDTNEFLLVNWLRHNSFASPKVKACISKELKNIKNQVFIDYINNIINYKTSIDSLSIDYTRSMDTDTQKEKEKEKEKEYNKNISIYVQHHHLKLTETERGELIEKHGKKDVEDMIKKIKSLSAAYLSKYDNMFLIIDAWIEKEKEKNCAAKQAPLSNVDLILSKYDK